MWIWVIAIVIFLVTGGVGAFVSKWVDASFFKEQKPQQTIVNTTPNINP
jgi:hypothetical protein